MRKEGLRDRDRDHKAARRGRTSFNNDAVPDRQSRSTLPPPTSYTLTDLLPLNDSFQIGVRRLKLYTTFVYPSVFSPSDDIDSFHARAKSIIPFSERLLSPLPDYIKLIDGAIVNNCNCKIS